MVSPKEIIKDTILKIMNTSLFSMEEKLKIINQIRKNNLSNEEIDSILALINYFDEGTLELKNKYYNNMDKIYVQYLDKNIPLLKQWIEKIWLETKETKINEKEGDPDMLLNLID